MISAVLAELASVDQWAKTNPKEAAAALQPQIGLDQPTLELALSRGGYGVTPVNDAVLAEQQRIADANFRSPKVMSLSPLWPSDIPATRQSFPIKIREREASPQTRKPLTDFVFESGWGNSADWSRKSGFSIALVESESATDVFVEPVDGALPG